MPGIQVKAITTRRELRAFVIFPWQVYRDDPNWVPALVSEQLAALDPRRGSFYCHAQVALFLAQREGKPAGTIAAFINHGLPAGEGKRGGFGFFEVLPDYAVAELLLDAACEWLRQRGATWMSGPYNFTQNERPGVLIEGADCPPVMLAAHTPLYYSEFLERYGMEKDHDLFAWRAFRSQIGDELSHIPPELVRVAEVARQVADVTIRPLDMQRWDEEIHAAVFLFNDTLKHLPDFIPMREEEFFQLANQMRPFLDPDLALFAKADGQRVGFCVALPDINQVLIHLNGRLLPFGWLRLRCLIREVDVATFKLMGVREAYRRRGIDALLYLEAVKAIYAKGYAWLDGSVTSEFNPMVNIIASRLGAERYKHFRVYKLELC
ncbi:MAG: hypothetical protein PHD58_11490 [Anaerolineales bacterium]|nr:hypothetical protein [Anaerolineales bacterium]